MRIALVFGTRPEAIKLMPLVKKFKEHQKHFSLIVCTTAQHREMMDQVLNIFRISIDYDLDIMEPNQKIVRIMSIILLRLEELFKQVRPDIVIIQGDTTTSLSAALAAYHQRIPVFHIEAGLRTYMKFEPYPEELNRQLISRISDFHFAPTIWAKNNLIKEGIDKSSIMVTGNTGIDALYIALKEIKKGKKLYADDKVISIDKKLIVVTLHRRENFGRPLANICNAIKEICRRHKDVEVFFSVHPNPNVKNTVYKLLKNITGICLSGPIDYLRFVYVLSRAYLLLTDSGGIQEEAAVLGKPVLICRNFTERPEIIDAGLGFLVGDSKRKILEKTERLLNKAFYRKISRPSDIYGDGHSSERILNKIIRLMNEKRYS